MSDRNARWLQQLRKIRQQAGRPLTGVLAGRTDIPEPRVIKILSGEVEPHRPELVMLIEAMSTAKPDLDLVLDAYDHRSQELPPLPPVPGWLQLLRVARYTNGQPTLRDLGARTSLSHGHIGDIFKGKANPSLPTLHTLVRAISKDPTTRDEILAAYQDENAPQPPGLAFPDLFHDPSPDARHIAAAIDNLADAIRSLTRDNTEHY